MYRATSQMISEAIARDGECSDDFDVGFSF